MKLRAGRRTLRCSFCGKSEREVKRLMGGARGGHICEVCVGVCNTILEATPPGFTEVEAMTDEQLLGGLGPSSAAVDATRQLLQAQVDRLRERGVSWEAIGKALGVSRQAAWERFS